MLVCVCAGSGESADESRQPDDPAIAAGGAVGDGGWTGLFWGAPPEGSGQQSSGAHNGTQAGGAPLESSPASLHDRLALHLAKMEYLAGRAGAGARKTHT